MIAYPHANTVSHNFFLSINRVMLCNGGLIGDVRGQRCYPGEDLAAGRNKLVESFLKSGYDHIWFIDTDIGFPSGALPTMLEHDAPVVSGFYNTVGENVPDGMGGSKWSTIPIVRDRDSKEYDRYEGVISNVGYVGAGCLLVSRSAMEKVGKRWFSVIQGWGEDYSFCRRLHRAHIPITVDCTFPLSHHKSVWI
jgi:GT2 family glycosyltransferase